MPSTPLPEPWLDRSRPHALLRVLVNGPHVVVATKGELDIDLVHVVGGRTRTLSVLGEEGLREELDAIADGAREPVRE
ncbi:hypothetical protein SEA_CEN1621_52 [Microbacterium phage Cen1621]|uniref:Uncharacterized protein n=1 Tax=Microbacterium phage Cen1621 TaxID=2965191 RepID=A0A9E7QAD0_9CAUD|nr:hypothetical protein SEA_CEN1621_52 [Microbacterium phage Cen1621]